MLGRRLRDGLMKVASICDYQLLHIEIVSFNLVKQLNQPCTLPKVLMFEDFNMP